MWDGESGEYMRAGQQMYLTFFFALAIVFLVLAAQFESFVHPAIIMVTVPLALLGAVFGLKLYGATINIFSQIAVIMLIGIAAKNGVLIVEFANQLRDQGVEFMEAVVKAAETRLRPVLDDQLVYGVRRVAVAVRDGRRLRAAHSHRHRGVLRHHRFSVPDAVRRAGRVLRVRAPDQVARACQSHSGRDARRAHAGDRAVRATAHPPRIRPSNIGRT